MGEDENTIKKFRGGTVNQIINHTPSSTSFPLGGTEGGVKTIDQEWGFQPKLGSL